MFMQAKDINLNKKSKKIDSHKPNYDGNKKYYILLL